VLPVVCSFLAVGRRRICGWGRANRNHCRFDVIAQIQPANVLTGWHGRIDQLPFAGTELASVSVDRAVSRLD